MPKLRKVLTCVHLRIRREGQVSLLHMFDFFPLHNVLVQESLFVSPCSKVKKGIVNGGTQTRTGEKERKRVFICHNSPLVKIVNRLYYWIQNE